MDGIGKYGWSGAEGALVAILKAKERKRYVDVGMREAVGRLVQQQVTAKRRQDTAEGEGRCNAMDSRHLCYGRCVATVNSNRLKVMMYMTISASSNRAATSEGFNGNGGDERRLGCYAVCSFYHRGLKQ